MRRGEHRGPFTDTEGNLNISICQTSESVKAKNIPYICYIATQANNCKQTTRSSVSVM